MIPGQNDTAVLLFARTVKAESAHKTLSRTRASNLVVHDTLLQHAISEIKKSLLPFFHVDEKNQKGLGFGEKLSNAFGSVISKGYKNIICVGGDCPHLSSNEILKAQKGLRKFDFVIGPDRGGGMYLIALRSEAFHQNLFTQISWQKGKDFHAFLSSIRSKAYSSLLLPVKHDVDHINSLINLGINGQLDGLRFRAILKILKLKRKTVFRIFKECYHYFSPSSLSLRAPPSY